MGKIFKIIIIAVIVYTATCLWTRFFDPSINCSPLNLITTLIQQILCMSIKLVTFILDWGLQLIAGLFGVTLNVSAPNIPCP